MSALLDSFTEIIILVISLAGFTWLALRRFEYGIYLAIVLLPLYLLKLKLFFIPFNVSETIIYLIFLIWLARKKWKDIKINEIKNFAFPFLIILIGTILATLFSDNLSISAGILKGWFLAPMVFVLVLVSILKEEKQIKKALLALFVSASLVAFVSLGYYLRGKITFDGRLSAIFLSPNHLAMYLSPGFLVGLWLLSLAGARKQKIILGVGLLVIALSLYLTFSYLAWLSVLITVAFWFLINFIWKEKSKNFFVSCFLFLVSLAAILFFSQIGSEKLSNLLYSSRSSWQSRLVIWKAAWEIGRDNPILGIGPGMFQEYYLSYQNHFAVPYLEWAVPQPHNLFLAFWLQGGILGLIGFIWLLIIFFQEIFAAIKKKSQPALILLSLMGYTILNGLFDTPYFKNDLAAIFWVIIALAASLNFIQDKKIRQGGLG